MQLIVCGKYNDSSLKSCVLLVFISALFRLCVHANTCYRVRKHSFCVFLNEIDGICTKITVKETINLLLGLKDCVLLRPEIEL